MQEEQIVICPGDLVLTGDYSEERCGERNRMRWREVVEVEREGAQVKLRVEGIDAFFDVRLILDWMPIALR